MRAHALSTLSRWEAPVRDARSGPVARGFTLMEVLVVVAIISLLAGLGAIGLSKVRVEAERRQTTAALQIAATAATEYAAQTGQTINPYDTSVSWPSQADTPIRRFVYAITQVPEALEVLRTLDELLMDEDSDMEPDTIVDAWGNELEYRNQVTSDQDFLPRHHRPYWASAGPDGDFGDATDSGGEPDEPAQDNLYSFNLD